MTLLDEVHVFIVNAALVANPTLNEIVLVTIQFTSEYCLDRTITTQSVPMVSYDISQT